MHAQNRTDSDIRDGVREKADDETAAPTGAGGCSRGAHVGRHRTGDGFSPGTMKAHLNFSSSFHVN